MELHRMWTEQCDATTGIRNAFGAQQALNYLIGEKLLDYIQATYLQFARANISAGLAGEKYYEYDYGYGPTRARTQRRLNMARLHVRDELLQVDAGNNAALTQLLGERGILAHYLED